MKILVQNNVHQNMFKVILALREVGVECIFWDVNNKSLTDLAIETKANILISTAISAREIPDVVNEFNLKLIVSDSVANINNSRLRPEIYCLTSGQAYFGKSRVLYLEQCSDLVTFKNGETTKNLETEVAYLSDNPNVSFDQLSILNLLCYPNSNLKFKAIGPIALNILGYVGNAEPNKILSLLRSSKIVIDFNQMHLVDYAGNSIFCLSDSDNDYFPNYNKVENISDLINTFKNPNRRRKICDKAKRLIFDQKLTNFHHAASLCNMLEYTDLEQQLNDKIKEIDA